MTRAHFVSGDFCWIELATPQLNAGLNFYQTLFGWRHATHPMPQGGDYAMFGLPSQPEEVSLGGAFEITPEMSKRGIPPHWGTYALAENIDATVEKARTLGATIIEEPFDVMEVGRTAVIQDPTGAILRLWQPKKAENGQRLPTDTPGAVHWYELLTHDDKKARPFYEQLFGWQSKTIHFETSEAPPNSGEYTVFSCQGEDIAGMMQIPASCNTEGNSMPSCWCIYFCVSNFDEAYQKAKSLGATECYPPKTMPGVGQFVGLTDPQGVYFSIIEPATNKSAAETQSSCCSC